MNVFSAFNGMGCIWIALDRLGVKVEKRYSSEIDRYANKVNDYNYPDTVQLGDISKVKGKDLGPVNLFVGGSPCQGFSFAGKGLNFDDPRSKLFFEFVRILKELREINPNITFLLENVRMKREHELVISKYLEVEPILINSNLVSAQNRERLYWTNIRAKPYNLFGDMRPDIPQPEDKGIYLKDIFEPEVDKKYILSERTLKRILKENPKINPEKAYAVTPNSNASNFGRKRQSTLIGVVNDNGTVRQVEKANCIDANFFKGIDNHAQRTLVKSVQINPSIESGGKQPYQQNRIYDTDGLIPALCAELSSGSICIEQRGRGYNKGASYFEKSPPITSNSWEHNHTVNQYRRLTPIECCRLQTVPDDYFFDENGKQLVSDTQIYKMLGNGWTVDVITHILSFNK